MQEYRVSVREYRGAPCRSIGVTLREFDSGTIFSGIRGNCFNPLFCSRLSFVVREDVSVHRYLEKT